MLQWWDLYRENVFLYFFFCQKPGWVFVITEYEVRMKVWLWLLPGILKQQMVRVVNVLAMSTNVYETFGRNMQSSTFRISLLKKTSWAR